MTLFTGHLVSSNPNDSPFVQANPLASKVPIYIAANTLSASFNTVPVDVGHLYGFSVTAVMSGNLTGSVAVFGANDLVPTPLTSNHMPSNFVLASDAVGSIVENKPTNVAMSGSQAVMFNLQQQFYRFLQVQFTYTSGAGSLDVFMTGKGNAT